MKLRDAITNLNRSDRNKAHVPFLELTLELGLNVEYIDLEKHGFSAYYLATWLCTDTWVGSTVIFYQDEPILLTWQSARKNDVQLSWIGGRDTFKRIHKVVRDLTLPEPDDDQVIDFVNMDEEMGQGIKVSYSQQLLDDVVIDDTSGQLVEVVAKAKPHDTIATWHQVLIRTSTGVEITVPMSTITVPWRVTTHASHDPS